LPVLFFLFWVILNARVTAEVVVIGIVIAAVLSFFTYRVIGLSFATEKKTWAKLVLIIDYLILLVIEIIKANIIMIKVVLTPDIQSHLKPQIVLFDSPTRSIISRVCHANSITITPGTIMVDLQDKGDRFGVYAINPSLLKGINDTPFVHKLWRIEGGH
jgi:multicomponent Na+:H+ antiporter subunit E